MADDRPPPAGAPDAGAAPDQPAHPPVDEHVDEASVVIDAPAEDVWDMVADVTRMGEWSPECYSCRWVGKRREPVVGARFVGFNRRGWARWFTTNEVELADRGRAFVFRTRETGVRWGYRLEPADGGGTRLTETRDLGDARMWVIKLSAPFVGGVDGHADELRAGMRETLERVKVAAESA
jgi:uncharacterized protein YndB with AHSA1/START domain